MKKVLLVLADGFEDSEGLTTRDVLIRSGIEVTTCGIKSDPQIQSSFGLILNTDTTIFDINEINDYDAIILPGGKRGVDNLNKCQLLHKYLLQFNQEHRLLAAICAAPGLLGRLGILKNKTFTCYSGFEIGYAGKYTGSELEIDDNIITARSMMYSVPFGLEIIKYLLGDEIKDNVYKGVSSLK